MKRHKRWRVFYIFLMIVVYGLLIPGQLLLWIVDETSFPYQIIIYIIAVPFIRKQHLRYLDEKAKIEG